MNTYSIAVGRVARIPTAVIRRRIELGQGSRVVPECCGLVWNALRAEGLRGGHNLALYRDSGRDVEAGVELTTPFAAHGDIVIAELPACDAASTVHLGPYGGLGSAHAAIQQWCKQNGRALSGTCWEIYGHWQKEWNDDPARIRTDVFYELAV